MIINVSEKKSYLKNNLVLYYLTTATRIYWKNETTLRLTICMFWVVSNHYLNMNYIVISDCIARKKKKKVTGWLHLATWVFLLILILCITMVNFLKFLWQILNEVFDQFFWQQCKKENPALFKQLMYSYFLLRGKISHMFLAMRPNSIFPYRQSHL